MSASPLAIVEEGADEGVEEGAAPRRQTLATLEARRILRRGTPSEPQSVLSLAWPGLADALPDGGLPKGVVELAAQRALGGATSISLAAIHSAQARDAAAWCAWIDPEASLHGPGLVASGVDLARLLVVRPPRARLARIAVKVVASGAFDVVVIDFDPVAGAPDEARRTPVRSPEVVVRKLALAAEAGGTTVLLVTDSSRPRAAVWPVGLRLELSRPAEGELAVRVGKDRRGRVGLAKTVGFQPWIRAAG